MTAAAGRRRAPSLPPEERRAAIVAAALPLLVERGTSVTTREIAEAAGVAEGTLFRVFGDKDALIGAVVDAAVDPTPLEEAFDAVDPSADLHTRVVEAVRITQRRIVDLWRLASAVGPAFRERMTRPLTDSEVLTRLLAPDAHRLRMEPRAAARLLRALTLAMTHPMLSPEPQPAEHIAEVLLHGIERHPCPRPPGARPC